MMLINIAFFLLVAAIIIAVMKPKSKTEVWLYSIIVPLVLAFAIAIVEASLSESSWSFSNKIAASIGGSLVSVIVSIPTLFIYLKKKLAAGENFKFPKGLIIAIVVLAALGLFSEWGNYYREKSLTQISDKQIDDKEFVSKTAKEARKLIQKEVESTNQKLPITEAGFTFVFLEIKDNALVAHFSIDENELNFDDYIQHLDKYKSTYFKQSTGHNPNFVNNLLASEYGWTLVLSGMYSGKTETITLSAKELQDVAKKM